MSDTYSVAHRWMDDNALIRSQSSQPFKTREEAMEDGRDRVASMGRGVATVFRTKTWEEVAMISIALTVTEADEVKMELPAND